MYGGYIIGTAAARPIPLRVEEQPAIGIGKYTTAWDLALLTRSMIEHPDISVPDTVQGVLMAPLPYRDPDRLVRLFEETPTTPHRSSQE